MKTKILIIGANGQIGSELALALAERHGFDAIVTSDVAPEGRLLGVAHEMLDVTDAGALAEVARRHRSRTSITLPQRSRPPARNIRNGRGR